MPLPRKYKIAIQHHNIALSYMVYQTSGPTSKKRGVLLATVPHTDALLTCLQTRGQIKGSSCPRYGSRHFEFEIQYHFNREAFASGQVEFAYMDTIFGVTADALSKPFPREAFMKVRRAAGLCERVPTAPITSTSLLPTLLSSLCRNLGTRL
jgi:hypothetical protein